MADDRQSASLGSREEPSESRSEIEFRHVALLLPNTGGAANLGDLLLHEVLVELLCIRGVRILNRDVQLREVVSSHGSLIAAAFARRRGKPVSATLVYPLGQGLGKSILKLPSVLVLLAYLGLLKLLGVRIVVLSRGIMYRTFVNSVQEYGLSRLADYYSLRDRDSIARIGTTCARRVTWFPDLSWLSRLEPPAQSLRTSVVLCFRGDEAHGSRRRLEAIINRLDTLLSEAAHAGIDDFVLVQHHVDDTWITDSIQSRYDMRYQLKRLPGVLSLGDVPHVYGQSALVVSNRLHSLLLGLQMGSQVLAVIPPEDTKIRDQFRDLGLSSHIIEMTTAEAQRGLVCQVMAGRDVTTKIVNEYRQTATCTAGAALASLFPGMLARP
jgi:polysaccharide pyruvyl transferase WcaK-like protein